MGDLIYGNFPNNNPEINFNNHHKKAKTKNLAGKILDKAIPIIIGGAIIAEIFVVAHAINKSLDETWANDNDSNTSYSDQVETDAPDYEIVMDDGNNQVDYSGDFQEDITNEEDGISR